MHLRWLKNEVLESVLGKKHQMALFLVVSYSINSHSNEHCLYPPEVLNDNESRYSKIQQ